MGNFLQHLYITKTTGNSNDDNCSPVKSALAEGACDTHAHSVNRTSLGGTSAARDKSDGSCLSLCKDSPPDTIEESNKILTNIAAISPTIRDEADGNHRSNPTGSISHIRDEADGNRRSNPTGSISQAVRDTCTTIESVQSVNSSELYSRQASRDHFDIYIIYNSCDEQRVNRLRDLLGHFVRLPGGDRKLTFCLEDIDFPYIADELRRLEESLQRSMYKFIFLSDETTIDELDQWAKFQMHQALYAMIQNGDQSIVPVIAGNNVRVPQLLQIYTKLDIGKLLCGKSLDTIDDDVTRVKVDVNLLRRISAMFNTRSLQMQVSSDESRRRSSGYDTSQLTPKRYKYLTDALDPDNGLLPELFAAEVISLREMETVKAGKTSFDRNECLLTLLLKKSDQEFQKFLVALSNQNMKHIVTQLQYIH